MNMQSISVGGPGGMRPKLHVAAAPNCTARSGSAALLPLTAERGGPYQLHSGAALNRRGSFMEMLGR